LRIKRDFNQCEDNHKSFQRVIHLRLQIPFQRGLLFTGFPTSGLFDKDGSCKAVVNYSFYYVYITRFVATLCMLFSGCVRALGQVTSFPEINVFRGTYGERKCS